MGSEEHIRELKRKQYEEYMTPERVAAINKDKFERTTSKLIIDSLSTKKGEQTNG